MQQFQRFYWVTVHIRKSVNWNKLIRPYICTLKKGRGVDQKTSQYLLWPPFASCSATHFLRIELIRLLIVACGMLSLCIIMLKHEVMAADEWHDNGPQDVVSVFLCIQIAIHKMQLCSLSIAYACPYHNPTATMGGSQRWHQQTTCPPNTIHVVCGCEAGWTYCQIL